VLFRERAKPLQQSIIELYEEFVFYTKFISPDRIHPCSMDDNGLFSLVQ